MPGEQEVRTIREAVGVFDNPVMLQEAIDDLLSSGFECRAQPARRRKSRG